MDAANSDPAQSDPPSAPASTGHSGPSRRRLLAGGTGLAILGGAAVVGGGGVGALARLAHDTESRTAPLPPVPPQLTAAIRREQGLIADLDATTGGGPDVRATIARVRADHAAHLSTLQAMLGDYRATPTGASSTAATGSPRTLAELRSAETAAQTAATQAAAELDSTLAVVLAGVAASEASHAAVLS